MEARLCACFVVVCLARGFRIMLRQTSFTVGFVMFYKSALSVCYLFMGALSSNKCNN